MPEQPYDSSTLDQLILLPEQQHSLIGEVAAKMAQPEASLLVDRARTLIAFSTDTLPYRYHTYYIKDPIAYADEAFTLYRESAAIYPVTSGWRHAIHDATTEQYARLRELDRTGGPAFRHHYRQCADRASSPLQSTDGQFGQYLFRSLQVVASAARLGADADHLSRMRDISGVFLEDMARITDDYQQGEDRRQHAEDAYTRALEQKAATEHRFPLADFWRLPDYAQLAIAEGIGSACQTVVQYAQEYGSDDALAKLAAPRLVRPTTELVWAMGRISKRGRPAVLQAFLDEGSQSASTVSFPDEFKPIESQYGLADEDAARQAQILEALWRSDIGDQVVVTEEGKPLPRKQFEAIMNTVLEGTAERLYGQHSTTKPMRKPCWGNAANNVAAKLLGPSHGQIMNMRIRHLEPSEAGVKNVNLEDLRHYEITITLKSSGKPAVETSMQAAVYSREFERYIELRRTARGRASGQRALERQQALSRQYARGRLSRLSHGLRAINEGPQQ